MFFGSQGFDEAFGPNKKMKKSENESKPQYKSPSPTASKKGCSLFWTVITTEDQVESLFRCLSHADSAALSQVCHWFHNAYVRHLDQTWALLFEAVQKEICELGTTYESAAKALHHPYLAISYLAEVSSHPILALAVRDKALYRYAKQMRPVNRWYQEGCKIKARPFHHKPPRCTDHERLEIEFMIRNDPSVMRRLLETCDPTRALQLVASVWRKGENLQALQVMMVETCALELYDKHSDFYYSSFYDMLLNSAIGCPPELVAQHLEFLFHPRYFPGSQLKFSYPGLSRVDTIEMLEAKGLFKCTNIPGVHLDSYEVARYYSDRMIAMGESTHSITTTNPLVAMLANSRAGAGCTVEFVARDKLSARILEASIDCRNGQAISFPGL